jgi:glycosyltransferase involved in cell wall biosynthesis
LDDWPVVTLVSRLGAALKLEGIERAIGAAALLAERTGLRLVIVGDGPARERVARAASDVNEQTGQATVTLTGELGDPRSAYAAADVVLGMGSSALRGMAFAKPLVVLGELGFAKLLTPESAGLFLWQGFYGLGDSDRRPELLAQILGPLLEDRTRQKALGAFSRQLVESRFSLCDAAIRQVDLYRDWLLDRPRRRDIWREAASTAFNLFSHKVRQRLRRSLGSTASEDFNAISEIKKTAALAGNPKF